MMEELVHGIQPSLLERLALEMDGMWEEGDEICKIPIDIHTDCEDVTSVVNTLTVNATMSKRSKSDVFDLRELVDLKVVRDVAHISGKHNPLDAISKKVSRGSLTMKRFRELFMSGRYQPVFGTNRREKKRQRENQIWCE